MPSGLYPYPHAGSDPQEDHVPWDPIAMGYTIHGHAGQFDGRLQWSDVMLRSAGGVDAYNDRVMATLAYYTRRYVSTPDLRIELADLSRGTISNDVLDLLAALDSRTSESDNDPDADPQTTNALVYLFALYGQ